MPPKAARDPVWWDVIAEWANSVLGLSPDFLAGLAATALTLVFLVLLRQLAHRFIAARFERSEQVYKLNKVVSYTVGIIGLLILTRIWVAGRVDLTTYFGILSAGLAIALQDPIANVAGWLFILVREPFRVNDRINIAGRTGDVVDLRLFMFSMLEVNEQSTGRLIHVPNGTVFKDAITNHTQGFDFVWNEIPVLVTFESDWKKAHEILQVIIDQVAGDVQKAMTEQVTASARKFNISYHHLSPIVWVEVADSGVRLVMRYLCTARARRSSADRIWRMVLDAFGEEPNIDLAYPTTRFYDNAREGKAELRPPEV